MNDVIVDVSACIERHRKDAGHIGFRQGMACGIVLAALTSLAVAALVQWWGK